MDPFNQRFGVCVRFLYSAQWDSISFSYIQFNGFFCQIIISGSILTSGGVSLTKPLCMTLSKKLNTVVFQLVVRTSGPKQIDPMKISMITRRKRAKFTLVVIEL